MYSDSQCAEFRKRLERYDPDGFCQERTLALYSASIAYAYPEGQKALLSRGSKDGIESESYYEIVLQSHLFLGYPRMLIAAEIWADVFQARCTDVVTTAYTGDEGSLWFDRGRKLYHEVYDSNAARLQERVESFAPEVFRWMIMEGYGKVLSRPQLPSSVRELAIVSCLTVENYPKQLFSHIRGALNTGADHSLVETIVEDLGPTAPGYETARTILSRLESST